MKKKLRQTNKQTKQVNKQTNKKQNIILLFNTHRTLLISWSARNLTCKNRLEL